MGKYRIYIDESGNADLKRSSIAKERFLNLTGVIIEIDYVDKFLHDDMENFKKSFFKYGSDDDPIIFHRKELMNPLPVGRLSILKDAKIRDQFDRELLKKLQNWNYKVITVLIDKKEHIDTYTVWKYDPYHYCLRVLLERYVFFLENMNATGDVMVESRNGVNDGRLKESFINIYNNGTEYLEAIKFQTLLTSKQLKVKPKEKNISGLQIADLIANPSRNDLLVEYKLKTKKNTGFCEKIIGILRDSKYHKVSGKLLGYGLKKLP